MMKSAGVKFAVAIVLAVAMLGLMACTGTTDDSEQEGALTASVIQVEVHGHVQLDVTAEEFEKAGYALGDIISVQIGGYEADMPYFSGYFTVPGEPLVRAKTATDPIALCINYGNFAEEIGVGVGDEAVLSLKEKAGPLDRQTLYSFEYSNDRADYESDEAFANFRPVTTGRISEGMLYRSSSPVDNVLNRAPYANRLVEEAGVATIVNLANSNEDIESHFLEDDFSSAYYQSLYESGQVVGLGLTGNFFTESFAQSLAKGFEFMADNEGPFLIHCKEGKDRAGFTSMLLGALMGASVDELVYDYVLGFESYYHITNPPDSDPYYKFLRSEILSMICYVAGVEGESELEEIDLEQAAGQFLINAGMNEKKLEVLKAKLG